MAAVKKLPEDEIAPVVGLLIPLMYTKKGTLSITKLKSFQVSIIHHLIDATQFQDINLKSALRAQLKEHNTSSHQIYINEKIIFKLRTWIHQNSYMNYNSHQFIKSYVSIYDR